MTSLIDIFVTIWVFGIPIACLITFFISRRKFVILTFVLVVVCGSLLSIQSDLRVPVQGATKSDWNPESFWYEPWDASVVHRGIDIFARAGADVVAPTGLFIFYTGVNPVSGNFVLAVDRSVRVHFLAHLQKIHVPNFSVLDDGGVIGTVGDSGNAKSKPPHLHYGLASMIPRLWLITDQTRGQLRAFYLDPEKYFSV